MLRRAEALPHGLAYFSQSERQTAKQPKAACHQQKKQQQAETLPPSALGLLLLEHDAAGQLLAAGSSHDTSVEPVFLLFGREMQTQFGSGRGDNPGLGGQLVSLGGEAGIVLLDLRLRSSKAF